jgi:uncharacterized protein YgbK (DUF1537 family)
MTGQPKFLLAYYGDDFTGSTDALEFLSLAGIKTVLFIEPPTPEQLAKYDGLQAIGVAGMTRSMPPQEMEKVLHPAFEALKSLGAPHVHYKVCSTFDSSPVIGSIGRAIDVGAEVFAAAFIPLLVAAPALGRYCAFGNLFARMGIGSKGAIFRLDRHPSMSQHPVTPADESDLRLHLGKQTKKRIGLMDILQVALPENEAKSALETTIDNGAEVVLFDAIYKEQLANIGALIDAYADKDKPLFSVGSSGIEMALGEHWAKEGLIKVKQSWPNPGKAEALLVISGSCSPVTSAQIDYALANGFKEVALNTAGLINEDEGLIDIYITQVSQYINAGESVIVHTSMGNADPRVEQTTSLLMDKGYDMAAIQTLTSKIYGTALGQIAKGVAAETKLKRIVIAGGDTSSFAARAVGIEAVEMIASVSPGAPLCKAYAPGSPVDGLEVNFKGGQVGAEDYFMTVLNGLTI